MTTVSDTNYSEGMRSLVDHLIKTGAIVSQDAASTMLGVDRKYYAPYDPYMDKPQPIGYSATISAPHMHAYSLVRWKLNHVLTSSIGTFEKSFGKWN